MLPQILGSATISEPHPAASPLTLSSADQVLLSASTTGANTTILTPSLTIDTAGKAPGAYAGVVTASIS